MGTEARSTDVMANTIYELRRTGKLSALDWWDTCAASVVIDCAVAGPILAVFAGLAQLLREGFDPEWLIGGRSPEAALAVARECLDAGVDPVEVAGWFRAGCYEATTATNLTAAGVRPRRLLDEDGRPVHWVEAPDGRTLPLATAVSEWGLPVDEAARIVARRNLRTSMVPEMPKSNGLRHPHDGTR